MTREEAIKKALSISKTGHVDAGETESYYLRNDGETGHYCHYSVGVDGVRYSAGSSYDECLEKLDEILEVKRLERVESLRKDLAAAESAIKL